MEEAKKLLKEENYNSKQVAKLIHLLSKAYGLIPNGINPNGPIAIASTKDNLISTATVIYIAIESWPKSLKIASKIFQTVSKKKYISG